MTCDKCGSEMEIMEVLVIRTTDPKDEDQYEDMFVCEDCGNAEPIIDSEEEDYEQY